MPKPTWNWIWSETSETRRRASVSTGDERKTRERVSLWLNEAGDPRAQGKVQSQENTPLVEKDEVGGYLSNLDTRKALGPEGMRPQGQRELASITDGHSPQALNNPGN